MENSRKVLRWKLCIIGDEEVGKTSIIRQFVTHQYNQDYHPTIGMNLSVYSLSLVVGQEALEIQFSLWDLAGQQSFQPFYGQFFQGVAAVIIVFDLTRVTTLTQIARWVQMVDKFRISHELVVVLGNKVDLISDRPRSTSQILAALEPFHLRQYYETSAKTGENILEVFTGLGSLLYHKWIKNNILIQDMDATVKLAIDGLKNQQMKND